MNRKICYCIPAVILIAASLLSGCGSSKNAAELQAESPTVPQIIQMLDAFASSHNARSDWTNDLNSISDSETIYSLDVHEALAADQTKPIMFIGYLRDILIEDGKYYAVFASTYLDIQFTLECSELLLNRIRTHVDRTVNVEIAVIANVDTIKKRESVKVMYPDTYDYEIEFAYETFDVFVARGTFVDFLYTGKSLTNIEIRYPQ